MKKFGKALCIMLGIFVGVPLMIIILCAIFGFGALVVTIPEVMVGVIGVLLIISIPGIIVGLCIGSSKK